MGNRIIHKPTVAVQRINKQTGRRLEPDEVYEVGPNTTVTESKKDFTGMIEALPISPEVYQLE